MLLRLEGDDEYLQQCVLRDQISAEPHKKHWDVQRKAISVARRLGRFDAIHAWYATLLANTMRARADDTCAPTGNGQMAIYSTAVAQSIPIIGGMSPWTLIMLISFILVVCGAILGAYMFHKFCSRRVPAPEAPVIQVVPEKRTIGVQSQTTYTSLRGVTQPRFHPLPEDSHGAFF